MIVCTKKVVFDLNFCKLWCFNDKKVDHRLKEIQDEKEGSSAGRRNVRRTYGKNRGTGLVFHTILGNPTGSRLVNSNTLDLLLYYLLKLLAFIEYGTEV